MNWNEESKNKLIEWIDSNYLNKNFGTVLKSEFELFIFSIYMDNLEKEKTDDYTVGKELGLTISRVRSLKERKALKFDNDNDEKWMEEFVACIERAKYDEVKHLVKMNIPDVNVMKAVRYQIEAIGYYDEYQLNPRVFQCGADIFMELCTSLGDKIKLSESDEKKLKDLEKKAADENDNGAQSALKKIMSGSVEDGLKDLMVSGTKAFIVEILKCVPFGGIAATAVECLVKSIEAKM